MKPDDIKPGTPVWYEGVNGRAEHTYAAVVDTEPWMLGGHTLVCHLRELDDRFAARNHGSRRVAAASVLHLRPRST